MSDPPDIINLLNKRKEVKMTSLKYTAIRQEPNGYPSRMGATFIGSSDKELVERLDHLVSIGWDIISTEWGN